MICRKYSNVCYVNNNNFLGWGWKEKNEKSQKLDCWEVRGEFNLWSTNCCGKQESLKYTCLVDLSIGLISVFAHARASESIFLSVYQELQCISDYGAKRSYRILRFLKRIIAPRRLSGKSFLKNKNIKNHVHRFKIMNIG